MNKKDNITPSAVYWYKKGPKEKVAVIVEKFVDDSLLYAVNVVDLNTGEKHMGVPMSDIEPISFLPMQLSLYGAVNDQMIDRLTVFLLGQFKAHVKQNAHPVDEAIRLLQNAVCVVNGAVANFAGYLATAKEQVAVATDMPEKLAKWRLENGLDRFETDQDWREKLATGVHSNDLESMKTELLAIVNTLELLANSQDVRIEGADTIRILCQRIQNTLGGQE